MRAPALRHPAVAGRFYPAKPETLTRQVDEYLGQGAAPADAGVLGCVVPHAGYVYSGHVAGAVYARLPARPLYVILCPNHTGRGAPLALMSSGEWLTPLGSVPIDPALAKALRQSCHQIGRASCRERV